ncbi:MAG: CBS domain-containing protein [Methanosarcinales archaeon Met12]|nr:MAG: CBS domain-containing protein [Methanosarcinales archaeon Met12]
MSRYVAKDIMAEALTIDKSAALSHAMDLMKKHGVRHLLVTKDDSLIGVVTQRTIARVLGTRKKSNLPASSLHVATAMTDKFATISPDEDVNKILHLFRDVGVVAVSNDKLVGWVTPKEVLTILKPKGCAGDIMSDPISVSPSERVVHVRRRMLDEDIGRMLVIEDMQLVGIITESDIARAMRTFRDLVPGHQQDSRIKNLLVSDIMSVNVKFIRTDTPLSDAIDLMLKENIGGLPVLNIRDGLVGMVTRRDIIRVEDGLL